MRYCYLRPFHVARLLFMSKQVPKFGSVLQSCTMSPVDAVCPLKAQVHATSVIVAVVGGVALSATLGAEYTTPFW